MLERLKKLFNKADFNPESRGVKAFEYQSLNGSLLLSNGIFFNHRNSPVRFVWPVICFCTAGIGTSLMSLHIYYSIKTMNVPDASESIIYILISNIVLVQMTVFAIKAKKIYLVIDHLDKDFLEMDGAPKHYRRIFYENQLMIWKINMMWFGFFMVVAFAFCSKTLLEILYQQLIQDYYEGRKRAEMFKTWLPYVDSNQSPIYEVFLTLSYIAIFMAISSFGSYISYLVQFILHSIGQFNLVVAGFETIFDFTEYEMNIGDEERRFILNRRVAKIAQRHQRTYAFCDLIFDVLGPTLLYQMVLSSIAICVNGFQVAESIQNGGLHILFTLLFIGSLVQLFIPCALGSMLKETAAKVGEAAYSCDWESKEDTKYIAKDLLIILLRTIRPLNLNAMGFMDITMETFSSIVSTAASYFTMLRQINEETS